MLVFTLSISPSIFFSSACKLEIILSNVLLTVWIESICFPIFSILSLNPLISVFNPLTLKIVNAKNVIQIIINMFVYLVPLIIINNAPCCYHVTSQMQDFSFLQFPRFLYYHYQSILEFLF